MSTGEKPNSTLGLGKISSQSKCRWVWSILHTVVSTLQHIRRLSNADSIRMGKKKIGIRRICPREKPDLPSETNLLKVNEYLPLLIAKMSFQAATSSPATFCSIMACRNPKLPQGPQKSLVFPLSGNEPLGPCPAVNSRYGLLDCRPTSSLLFLPTALCFAQ